MRILVDANVLLDVMCKRDPARREFAPDSGAVLDWCEANAAGAVAWHTLANCYYLAKDKAAARRFLEELLLFAAVPATDTVSAYRALQSSMTDFEDAMQVEAAKVFQADLIVTRNTADFKRSEVPAISPAQFRAKVGI